MSEPQRTPPALALSAALGGLGVLLFFAGAAVRSNAFFIAGVTAGALSLGAALYWRSELIREWRQGRRHPGR